MSKPLTRAQLRSLEPRYTIAGLFESGRLGKADEEAMEEIKATRDAFANWVNPSRGWMSLRMGDSNPAMPRMLGNAPAWQRYKTRHTRWSFQVVAPSPGRPWGMTGAQLVMAVIMEPGTFNDLATVTGKPSLQLVELFIAAMKDYGRIDPIPPGNFQTWLWDDANDAYTSARVRPSQQARWRAKKRRQRANRRAHP